MTAFFWFTQLMNLLVTALALGSLMLVLWLSPRRWVNQSYALFVLPLIIWSLFLMITRIMINEPVPSPYVLVCANILSFAFSGIGNGLFLFITSFYPLPRRWAIPVNMSIVASFILAIVFLIQGKFALTVYRDPDGTIGLKNSPEILISSVASSVYFGIIIYLLIKNRSWHKNRALTIGTIIILTSFSIAAFLPSLAIYTFLFATALMFMTYEVLKQQLFSPMVTLNQRLEVEVAHRTEQLKQTLAEQERVKSELAIARTIQQGLLPVQVPTIAGVRLAAHCAPAREVGGDYFTFHHYSEQIVVAAVGDISGKGIPAALLMALTLRTFEMLVEQYQNQAFLLMELDRTLKTRLSHYKMNTALLNVLIDRQNAYASVANAGGIAPMLWRDGHVRVIESYGLPIGTSFDAHYHQVTFAIKPGDRILLTSDGFVEAMNPAHELWGFERLEASFQTHGANCAQTVVDTMVHDVDAWISTASPSDDRTIVVVAIDD